MRIQIKFCLITAIFIISTPCVHAEEQQDLGHFLFLPDRDELAGQSSQQLDDLAGELKKLALSAGQIYISGYTAKVDNDIDEFDLSIARVNKIVSELQARGISSVLFSTTAKGSTDNWGDNIDEIGRMPNRRVTIAVNKSVIAGTQPSAPPPAPPPPVPESSNHSPGSFSFPWWILLIILIIILIILFFRYVWPHLMAAGPFGGGGSGRASNGETFNKTPAGTRIPGGNNDSGLTRLSGESFREEKSLMKRLNIRPIRGEHDVLEDLKSTNPNYDQTSFIWSSNCQRTVPAWEARRRGYNATARPILTDGDYLSRNWTAMYKNPEIIRCSKNGKEDIIQLMKKWGEGARCEIAVEWPNGSGHVFAAENIDGEVWFFDPQTNSPDCSGYFDMVSEGSVEVLRTDNLEFDGNFIKDCIKEA